VSTDERLTGADMGDVGRLARLASNPKEAGREEIYLAVVSLYRVQGDSLGPRERALMNDILRRVESDVRPAIRASLAERLADDASAPIDVILMLATDAIDIASPIIAHCPLLTDDHLVGLIGNTDTPHRTAIASRFDIGEAVTRPLAELNDEGVLLALLQNGSARFCAKTFDLLAEKSLPVEVLRNALMRRSDLPATVLQKLGFSYTPRMNRSSANPPRNTAAASQCIEPGGVDRLVAKLASSGQLRAGFLLRVLQQGQLDLFDAGLARLLDLPLAQSRERFYSGGATAVALACRAVGIDRCVFPTVYTLSRQSHGMASALSPSERKRVDEVFIFHSKPTALAVLRAA